SAPAPQAAVEVSGQDIPRTQGGRFYSPLVRSIARKEGISKEELAGIPGTGLEGRVTKKDILAYLDGGRKAVAPAAPRPVATPAAAPAPAAARPAPQPSVSSEEVAQKYAGKRVEVIPMDNIRRKIAEHMVMSKSTSPHVYGVAETDFTRVMSLVKKHRDSFKAREGIKLTMNPFILYSVSKALVDFPDINSSVDGSNIIRKNYINVGMAVATEHGLLVPTLKNTDQMNFRGIALNAYDLAIKARDRKLTLDQIQDSTFTVTNYGVFGNVIGYPIINQPNVAILGVAAVKKRPVVLETEAGDVIAIRQIGYMTLSYDHRLVDGELGDKFLQRVVHYLENFEESWL
nr:dihydrolipoamide acetyltransferase family protein [Calditrichia bacterium]